MCNPMEKKKIYVIVGPTASGKTAAAVEVAEMMNAALGKNAAEIVSADSIQIYRGLDIGSAKPNEEEKRGIVHHLLDVTDYTDPSYNVAVYRENAVKTVDDIISRGGIPIVVGGTGLYINSIVYPLNFSEAEPDFKRREELAYMEQQSPGILLSMLSEFDPQTAARLHPNDIKRIIRAIEVYERTGETLSSACGDFKNEKGLEIEFEPIMAGLNMPRALLYERIEMRIDKMLENGLVDEVRSVLKQNPDRKLPSLQGLGYKQIIMYLDGVCSFDDAVYLIKRDTRRFAKRQISWFKRDKRIRWFDPTEYSGNGLAKAIYDYFTD